MRIVYDKEMRQRGCILCQDFKRSRNCPYEECPYHDLDEFTTIEEFYDTLPPVDLRELFKNI